MKTKLLMVLLLAVPTLAAAQQPTTVRVLWDMNPSSERVDYYYLEITNNPDQTVETNGPQCNVASNTCYADFQVTTNQPHTVSNWAHNPSGWSDGAYLTFTVGRPTPPSNMRLQFPPPPPDTRGFQTVAPTTAPPAAPPPVRQGR